MKRKTTSDLLKGGDSEKILKSMNRRVSKICSGKYVFDFDKKKLVRKINKTPLPR